MKRLVILGAGESGVGAAILGKDKGMDVFVSDFGHIKDKYTAMLDAEGIPYEQGGPTAALILNAAEVVKSPGIP
ncbi:MAG: UDP-N-acetylmuramoyl-L-alanine--D-glutamate ligase, partial [Muribaculaceae bacterium]|nr:UDP-N-acetylmuramoyl-L-alanine--D-glutamate ligase [Muribaculaceae bacterium]